MIFVGNARVKDENRSPNERERSPNEFHLVKETIDNPWTSYGLRHPYNSGKYSGINYAYQCLLFFL